MIVEQQIPRSLQECCSLLGYSRQAFYQYKRHQEKEAFSSELLLQEVLYWRKRMKRLGGKKLLIKMQGFMQQHGIAIGRDAFFNLLRENGLLVRRRRCRVKTTNSRHWLRKYPYLIEGFIPVCANQLWVSDITYIRLLNGFAYLSLITDVYSRKIMGFYLSRDLSAKGSVQALKMAMKSLPPSHKLIHHSDRGVQYCSAEYVEMLSHRKVRISMTQSGSPLENALAERVNGILKDELLEKVYPSFEQAKLAVAIAISMYNFERPHSSVEMLTPAEAYLKEGNLERRWKSYYPLKKKEVKMT